MSATRATKVPLWVVEGLSRRGWSQAELSRRTGLNTNTISYVLAGKRPPNQTTLQLIAKAFEADPEGTALAIGSAAAKGVTESMIHDDPLFADIYLSYKDISPTLRRKLRNYAVGLKLGGNAREAETTEEDV